jgi:O-methyltransferase
MGLHSWLRRLLPEEFQWPRDLPRRILSGIGYYRLVTWLGSRGGVVPDAHLYQPLFSPWQGMPEFAEHDRAIRKHTLVSRDRCHVLWRTLQQSLLLPGDLVECGVFRGGTALLEARTLAAAEEGTSRRLHLFDSFQGMPGGVSPAESFRPGHLGRTSAAGVRRLLAAYPFVQLHVGFIPDTFAGLGLGPVAWAHVDLDLYQATRDAIAFLYPRLVPGGFLIFDDYGFPSCPGARRAVDEAFAGRPEVPLCLPTGQCLVVKLPGGDPGGPVEPSARAAAGTPIPIPSAAG